MLAKKLESAAKAVEAVYIEDVFSTWLYTGNGSTQTITNGIDLAGKGGLVWLKCRNTSATHHVLFDSARGANKFLFSDLTNAQVNDSGQTLNANGFTIGDNSDINTSSSTYVSWTFRKQAKFFDVVTYTGNGTAGRSISHALGSRPGCIIVKCTSNAADWRVWHRSIYATNTSGSLSLNTTGATTTSDAFFSTSDPTDTVFYVGDSNETNVSGRTYVACLFAHNAGGFGLTGTDNVISCGSYTGSSSDVSINLGYEAQWVMVKNVSRSGTNWQMLDIMRGMPLAGNAKTLAPNLSDAESSPTAPVIVPTATGMTITGGLGYAINYNGDSYIYIAIRRGPMKTPTSGTSVFGLNSRTGTGANATVTGGAGVSDAVLIKNRGAAVGDLFASRLTGTGYLETSSTATEVAAGTTILQANPWDVMDGAKVGTTSTITNASANTYINYLFDRAPGFFDEVCYTSNGSAVTLNHNLTVVPELVIFKARNNAGNDWVVYRSTAPTKRLDLNSTNAEVNEGAFGAFTSTTMTLNVDSNINSSTAGRTYVTYLFATCPGVSKVGSYTGSGTTKQIDCGFTGGARFVLIKRTDSTGDWYVWDSARGIVAGNDPYLLLNSTAAEVTNTDYVDTYAQGFEISSTAPAAINANNGTFIFLAVA